MGAAAVLVDGVASECLSVTDRGLAFGDGVFRTFAIRGGRPLNWRWQYLRLAADCSQLGLDVPDKQLLARELERVSPADATAKIVITRGAATRGYAIPAETRQSRIVMAFDAAADPAGRAEAGVAVRRCSLVLSEQPRLAGAKTLNRLENVLARSEWDDPAVAEGLLADASGNVIGGTMSNLFVVKDGRAATPALSRCGVVGAQRERVRERMLDEGIDCAVRDVRWEEMMDADEVFLTNSLIGAWPVASLESRRWAVGAVTRRVRAMIADDDARA